MWFEVPQRRPDWSAACKHLRKTDPVLRHIIDRVGECSLHPRRDYFVVLCKSIFTQQISTAVATILFGRFRDLFPRRRPTPRLVLAASETQLRSCGLSRQKQSYLRDLAEKFDTGALPVRKFSRMSDEQIIESLDEIRGVGRWTAEMFLMFVLNRPDVLPVDDLGLRKAVKLAHQLPLLPTAKELTELAEPWRPYRSIATWYLWCGNEVSKPVGGDDSP